MNIKEMHYDFKKKLNKVDSQQYRNLRIPEIDWVLNESARLFVKMIAEPRLRNQFGFETSQRTIDDIRTIVINPDNEPNQGIAVENNIAILPIDYWHYLRAYALMKHDICKDKIGKVYIRQHDDSFEESPLDKSSYEWKTVNAVFFQGGVKFYTDGSFSINEFYLSYIRKMQYMHNAEDFGTGSYTLPSGQVLTGIVNCELPWQTHDEIVDIAVMITTGEIESQVGYQFKKDKLNLNKIN